MDVWAVVNLKGGSSKTTTAAHVAHGLAARGRSVLLVDADPQGSSLRWSQLAKWDGVDVVPLAVRDLHRKLPGIVGDRYETIVIDTPPMEDHRAIVVSALRAADLVVVTMAPTMIELDRLPPVWAALDDVVGVRDVPPVVTVLLTRVVPRASSTVVIRASIVAGGREVLEATVPRREAYAQAFGAPVVVGEAYEAVTAELLALAGAAA